MPASDEHAPVSGERLRVLKALGYGELMHDSHVPFLSHLIGTRRVLREWGCRPALCDAGLFHSAYGTEYFEPEQPASRDEVRALIGAEAERVAWLWCSIERHTLDLEQRSARLRLTAATETLSDSELCDIATLWAADTVEQIERMTPEEREFAGGLRAVLPVATDAARAAVSRLGSLVPSA